MSKQLINKIRSEFNPLSSVVTPGKTGLFTRYLNLCIRNKLHGFPCERLTIEIQSDRLVGRCIIIGFPDNIQVSHKIEPFVNYNLDYTIKSMADAIMEKFKKLCEPFRVYCEELDMAERWLELAG